MQISFLLSLLLTLLCYIQSTFNFVYLIDNKADKYLVVSL